MKGAARLYWVPFGRPCIGLFVLLAGLSTVNWLRAEQRDALVCAGLGVTGVLLCARLQAGETRLSAEYLLQLPVTRPRALFSPYFAGGLATLALGLLVHLHESTGAAYYELRALSALTDPAAELVWRRRALEPLPGFLVYPLLGFFGSAWLAAEWRHRFPALLAHSPWREWCVHAAVTLAVCALPQAATMTGGAGGAFASVLGALAVALAVTGARRRIVAQPVEGSPLGGAAWDS